MTAFFPDLSGNRNWKILFFFLFFSVYAHGQTTLYTYQSGDWNNPDVWTTDPGGSTLAGSRLPGNGDAIVILSSRIITLSSDITHTGLDITINEGGTLDASSYSFTGLLAGLRGSGTYMLKSAAFPSAAVNTLTAAGGGTVEYYNDSHFILPSSLAEYYNLKINCPGVVATQLSNIIVHGSLWIRTGTLRINDETASRRTLVVKGDITVDAGAALMTGTGNTTSTTDPSATGTGGTAPFLDYYTAQSHRIEVYGNITNNGTIRFTSQSFPVFDTFPSNGFASVFLMGTSDNTLTCNGQTDFYNLIINKGTDQTYILSVNSAGYDRFRIFGANSAGEFASGDAGNPNIRKALWIRNGTLRLNGYVFIPSLVEGSSSGSGNFIIPDNGALLLGGPEVVVMGTTDDYSAVNLAYGVNGGTGAVNGVTTEPLNVPSSLDLYGKLQINSGYLYIGETGRIIYYGTSAAQFIINGGIIDIKQFQSVSGGGKTAYWQTGGALVLRGRFRRDLAYTSLPEMIQSIGNVSMLNTSRASSGGLPLGTDPAVGTLNLDQDANIFHMEGGTIDIFDVSGSSAPARALEINSDPSNVSVSGGTISINITAGSVLPDEDYGIASKAPVCNLNISRNSGSQSAVLLSVPVKGGVTPEDNPPLTVINDLVLANNSGSANPVLNSSGFDVLAGGNFSIGSSAVYTPGTNRTILNGTGAQLFSNNGTITSGLFKFVIDKISGTVTLGSDITVLDSLAIFSGILDDGGYVLHVAGNIFNSGVHTGSGRIILNGSAVQILSSSPGETSVLGNVELQNPASPAGAQLAGDLSLESLVLTADAGGRSVFDINDHNLNITDGSVISSGTLAFGTSKMIRTSGSSSDKGLTQSLSLAGTYTGQLVSTFPVGVGASYYPALVYCSGSPGTVTGAYTIIPVNAIHPATDPGKISDALPFYWRSGSSGFQGLNNSAVNLHFYHPAVNPPLNKSWYLVQGTWMEGTGASGGIAIFGSAGFPVADFTAGKNNPFRNPTTYYSRMSGPFNLRTTWSTDPVLQHIGAAATSDPQPYDMIVIGGQPGPVTAPRTSANDSVTVTAALNVASITINGSYTGDSRLPVLNMQSIAGIIVDIIRGNGKFCSSTGTIPASDYGELVNSETAVFHFYGGSYSLPAALDEYPNLLITGNAEKYLNAGSVVVRKDLILADDSNAGNILSLNNSLGNLTVLGSIRFRNGSTLRIPASTLQRTIDVYGDIDFSYGNSLDANRIEAISGSGTVHRLNFYGSSISSGASDMSFNPEGTNKIDLYFKNAGSTGISNGTGIFSLHRLFIMKEAVTDTVYFRNDFTLDETANATAAKSLNLNTGTLVLSDPLNGSSSTINLNLSSGGTNYFSINSSSGLVLRNGSRINITGNTAGSGIHLDGFLGAEESSQILLADGSSSNTGYIEYSGSGNAAISLSGSSVLSAAQVRRSLLLTTGLLKYSQGGSSAVTLYGTGAPGIIDPSRAKLEITGAGSSFSLSDTASISVINGGGTTFGDLYLRPAVYSVTGGEIIFGTGTSGQSFRMDATTPLHDLVINAEGTANELQFMVNPVILNGDLVLSHPNSTLTTNNIDLTIKGNFTDNGIYNAGSNTTFFSGSDQLIDGNNDPLFWNLTSCASVKLTPGRDITVNNELNITGGLIEAGSFNITVRGNVVNNGAFTNSPEPAASRLYLNGTSLQNLSGPGAFGRIELDNNAGARLGSDLALSENLILTSGVFDINQHSLILGSNSNIISVGFDAARMIRTDGVYSNGGITKNFTAGYSGSFVYPIGVSGKYTPATLGITATNAGSVRINPINERHPATLSPFDVLNYYWECESSISGFDGNLSLTYSASDVTGDESQYVAARLIIPPGTGWSKAAAGPATDNVDESVHAIMFDFPSGTASLGGQYTAGYTSCLPNTIPVYRSNVVAGNWDTPGSWTPLAPAGGPNGFAVIIEPGHTILTNGNRRFSFRTTINGTLDVGTTYGHNLGTVDGTGKLSLQQPNLPAGDFSSFTGCSGGTLEYGGTASYTIVADRIDTIRNLHFTGSGTRTLPDKDLVICNQLQINGPSLDNHFNRKLTLGGSFDLTAGAFISGTGPGATVSFKGSSAQTVTGFNGSSPLNNLEIDNAAGLSLGSAIEMNGNLVMLNGNINTTAGNILRMTNQSGAVTGGGSASFVNGPMSKNQPGGVDFVFPLGNDGRYGKLGLLNPQTGTWEAEYINTGYPDTASSAPLTKASGTEYWRIKSPADGKNATVQLRWDSQNEITPVTTANGISDIRVAEYDGAGWIEKASVASGNDSDGTVQTASNVTINNTGHPQFYTLGAVSPLKPTILPGVIGTVCRCLTTAWLPYNSTTGNPDQYSIDFETDANSAGFADVAWTALPSSPIAITVPSAVSPGIYNANIMVRVSSPVNTGVPYPISIIVIPDFGWTGAVSTDWNLASNWSCAAVPGTTIPVVIQDVPNKPVLSAGIEGSVNNLTISAGSSLTVTGNTLQISGTLTGNGNFTATEGHIELNGSSPQVIGAGVFSTNTVGELSVSNPAGVTLQGPLNVTGPVRVQGGTLASGGNLTLISAETGTAFIDGSGNGLVTGTVTMQRYLPSGFGYKYFSSPFQAATVGEFADDVNLGAQLSFHRYVENRMVSGLPASGWELYNNPAAFLEPVSGYSVNFGSSSMPVTADVRGAVNNGSLSVTLFNNNQTFTRGMNLVGNPYPSAIDWNSPSGWTKTNIDNALYFFRASATDQYGGAYSTYVNGISSDGIASNIIPSMQGFFVHVSNGIFPVTGTLAMDNRVRVNDMAQPFISKSAFVEESSLLRLTACYASDQASQDPLVIYYDEKATSAFDSRLDALKIFNTDYTLPDFFSVGADGSRLSINALPAGEKIPEIPLGIRTRKNGEICFGIRDLRGSLSAEEIFLFDAETGTVTDLTRGEYRVTLSAGNHYSRFFLNYADVATGVQDEAERQFLVYSSGNILHTYINCLRGKRGTLRVTGLTGQAVFAGEVYENGHHEFILPLNDGIYIVSFFTGHFRVSQKIIIQGR